MLGATTRARPEPHKSLGAPERGLGFFSHVSELLDKGASIIEEKVVCGHCSKGTSLPNHTRASQVSSRKVDALFDDERRLREFVLFQQTDDNEGEFSDGEQPDTGAVRARNLARVSVPTRSDHDMLTAAGRRPAALRSDKRYGAARSWDEAR